MILVVAYHAAVGVSGGFVGVDVFFVVSGFVITGLLVRELERSGRLSFRAFYARRIRRLLPALGLVLLAVAAVAPLVQTPLGSLQSAASTGLATGFFGANAELFANGGGYFDVSAETNPLLHMWTLAVEEQFYLAFPAVLLVSWRLARRLRRPPRPIAVAVVTVVAVMSLILCEYMTFASGSPFGLLTVNRRFAFYSSPTRAWEFSAGALVALAEPRLRRALGRPQASLVSAIAAALLAATVLLARDSQALPGFLTVAPVAGTVGLLVAGNQLTRIAALLSSRWAVWVGDHSYSWYLWHWPLIVFVRIADPRGPVWALALAGIAGLPLAWLTGRLIESPVRYYWRITGWRLLGLGAACCLVPTLAFSGLLLFSTHPPAAIRQLVWQGREHLDATRSCINDLPKTAKAAACTWTVPGARGTVLVVGDSNAGQFAEPILAIAKSRTLNFTLATYGGCPFAPVSAMYEKTPHDTSACDGFVKEWSAEIARTKPAVVVIASAASTYVESADVSFQPADGSSQPTSSPKAKAVLWRDALSTMVRRWSAAGVPSVVVNTVPQFGTFDLRQCPAYIAYSTPSRCAVQAQTSDLAKFAARSTTAEEAAVAGVTGASTLNLFDEICGQPICSTYQHGEFAYRDGVHLSVPFAEQLQPQISESIDHALGRGSTR